MSISVGIDLGTTFSAVAYIDPKTKLPQIIPNSEGSKLTPSVIQFLDGDVIFGSEAEDAYNAGEEDCVATFKREMGVDKPYCYIDGKPYTSEELSAMLLKHLKDEAEATIGETIKDAVITVPAYFYSKEREATIRAAETAGLKVKKIIDEPNAAAMAYGLEEAGLSQKDVTDVLLVGGSTRMPQVPAYLQRLFNKRPLSHVNPDEAVALGAAIQSSKENEAYAALSVQVVDGKKTTDRTKSGLSSHVSVRAERKLSSLSMLTLRETTAHAMGVIAINDEGNHYYNEIIIPANHPRPVRAAKKFRFYTSPRTANELAIYVLQGDSENPLDCQITYKYVVTGIKHVNRGEKIGTVIRIQYSYDVNGVIHIQARQEDSTVDLPIRRENIPADISKFGQPVTSDDKEQGFNVGLQLGTRSSQSLVHKYKAVTFSNVEWVKYDNIQTHPSGAEFNEPTVHVIANEENIEFHGYNISEMNEGVRYTIDSSDDFEIECDINTSTISPHPGGYLEISLGLISAHLTENGGDILMDGVSVATVAPRFHLKMSLTNGGQYEVEIDRRAVGSRFKASKANVDVRFGFVHESHYCHLLSHAYISDISMMQAVGQEGDDNPDTETWDD